MPDAPTTTSAAQARLRGADSLASLVAAAVLTVPGVTRLEPTLSTAGPDVLLHRSPADGVRLTERAGVVDVDVDIATAATSEARATTHHVQTRIAGLIGEHGHTPGSISVSVLSIDLA